MHDLQLEWTMKVRKGLGTGMSMAHPSIGIIFLRLFIELIVIPPSMNHSSVHGYGFLENVFKEFIAVGLSHRVNSPLGKGEID